jgi:sulfate/thiosulfate transport system permease protein
MRERPVNSLGAILLLLLVLGYAGILLVAPMVAIVVNLLSAGWQSIIESLTTPEAFQAMRLTLVIAVLTAIINTITGIVIAWVLVRHDFKGKQFFNGLVDLPFVMSPVIVGYVVIVLFGRGGWFESLPIAFTPAAMLLVTVFVSLPFVVREVMPVLATLTPQQEEAAYTLGASRWMTFRRIVLPGIRHGVIYGLVLTFARALGEFGAAAVAGGGVQGYTENVTIYIYRSLHDRNTTAAYSMAVLLGVVSVLVLMIANTLPNLRKGANHVD